MENKELIDTIDMWIRLTKKELKQFTHANIQMDERDISDLTQIKHILENRNLVLGRSELARIAKWRMMLERKWTETDEGIYQCLINREMSQDKEKLEQQAQPDEALVDTMKILDEFILGVEGRRIEILDSPMKTSHEWAGIFKEIRELLLKQVVAKPVNNNELVEKILKIIEVYYDEKLMANNQKWIDRQLEIAKEKIRKLIDGVDSYNHPVNTESLDANIGNNLVGSAPLAYVGDKFIELTKPDELVEKIATFTLNTIADSYENHIDISGFKDEIRKLLSQPEITRGEIKYFLEGIMQAVHVWHIEALSDLLKSKGINVKEGG